MTTPTSIDIAVKPRVLIADDSRIVRATLIKHIEGMFEFREALDGEEAWETLLTDPNIRVVITDLTMPKLDGYGLLQRIRSSTIGRIRDIPVVVVSGSDESAERERVLTAGANDLITKGIDTAQLLSRLDVLSQLVTSQGEFERSLERLVRDGGGPADIELLSPDELHSQAETQLASALRHKKNFVVLNVCIGLKHASLAGKAIAPPTTVADAVGQLLLRTVRQTDHVAKTGKAEFTLATGSINFDAARGFAERVCKAIAGASLLKDERISFIASCGLVSLAEAEAESDTASVTAMTARAHARAVLGLDCSMTGVIGLEEEIKLKAQHS
jgi:two-component system, cell cycle response regulator